jgi:hypothetical protein
MSGFAGRKATVSVTGAPVTFTAEATTDAGDHQNYQITATTKRVWDRATTLEVDVSGTPTGELYTFNRLTGTVTFATVNAGRGPVTVTGAYLPLAEAVGGKSFSYSLSRAAMVDTDFSTAAANFNTYQAGMLDVEGSIGLRFTTDTTFHDALLAGNPVVIAFFFHRSGPANMIIWALLDKDGIDAAIDGIMEGTIEFKGTADDQGVAVAAA